MAPPISEARSDIEIETNEYGRELQQDLRALAAQSGRAFSLAEARALGLDAAVLSRLVNRAALDHEIAELGLSVGDVAVRDQITQIPAFRGVDGAFDRDAYAFTLDNAGLSIAEAPVCPINSLVKRPWPRE